MRAPLASPGTPLLAVYPWHRSIVVQLTNQLFHRGMKRAQRTHGEYVAAGEEIHKPVEHRLVDPHLPHSLGQLFQARPVRRGGIGCRA